VLFDGEALQQLEEMEDRLSLQILDQGWQQIVNLKKNR
jgi:hypothetical protein